jgi:hypothetical protein
MTCGPRSAAGAVSRPARRNESDLTSLGEALSSWDLAGPSIAGYQGGAFTSRPDTRIKVRYWQFRDAASRQAT